MLIFLIISYVLIDISSAEHQSNSEMEVLDTWLITAISIGSTSILLLMILLCCCCCPFCRHSESKPNRNRFRRSSSFRFNRSTSTAPSAPIAMEEPVETDQERILSLQNTHTDGNDSLRYSETFSNASAPYPPAYSTLPSSGHRTIATTSENVDSMAQDISPRVTGNIRLERSDTTVSDVWYDASTLER